MTVLLASGIDMQSGVSYVLSSGGQGDGEQDRILANNAIIKKVVEQECGIICPVAYIGLGQTGRDLVKAEPTAKFCYSRLYDISIGVGARVRRS